MKYPPLSDSLILPVVNDIFIYAGYESQSYKAYKENLDKIVLVGELAYEAIPDGLEGNKVFDKWLQDVGYINRRKV